MEYMSRKKERRDFFQQKHKQKQRRAIMAVKVKLP